MQPLLCLGNKAPSDKFFGCLDSWFRHNFQKSLETLVEQLHRLRTEFDQLEMGHFSRKKTNIYKSTAPT